MYEIVYQFLKLKTLPLVLVIDKSIKRISYQSRCSTPKSR